MICNILRPKSIVYILIKGNYFVIALGLKRNVTRVKEKKAFLTYS